MGEKLEKIQKTFLWTGLEEKKCLALVNWDTMCLPKSLGGLGIRKINALNKALIAKIGWNLTKDEADWCNIIKAKYLDREHFYYNLNTTDLPQGSKLWNNILKSRVMVREGLKWQLGDGRKVRFWEDFLMEDGPLVNIRFYQIMNHLKGILGEFIADYLVPTIVCWKDIVLIYNNRPNLIPLS